MRDSSEAAANASKLINHNSGPEKKMWLCEGNTMVIIYSTSQKSALMDWWVGRGKGWVDGEREWE